MSNVLITGTSSGIGLAAAVELARRGERVFASMRDLSRSGPLEEAAAEAGVQVELVQLDVTDTASVERAVTEVVEAGGSIDVVVNNAAIAPAGPLEFASDSEIAVTFETNTIGPLRVVRAALPHMRAQGCGRIVNVSTPGSHPRIGARLMALYVVTKAALAALTLELAKEVAPLGIDVVLLEGGIGGRTGMTDALRAEMPQRDAEHSPYRLSELWLKALWDPTRPGRDPGPAAVIVAEACTMADPPLRHPWPDGNSWLHEMDSMSDERFMRLARFDRDDELYKELGGFWPLQKAILDADDDGAFRHPWQPT